MLDDARTTALDTYLIVRPTRAWHVKAVAAGAIASGALLLVASTLAVLDVTAAMPAVGLLCLVAGVLAVMWRLACDRQRAQLRHAELLDRQDLRDADLADQLGRLLEAAAGTSARLAVVERELRAVRADVAGREDASAGEAKPARRRRRRPSGQRQAGVPGLDPKSTDALRRINRRLGVDALRVVRRDDLMP